MENEFISITDDFMFCSVMEDKEKCKEFLQRVLNINIVQITVSDNQKTIKNSRDSKGIRLDVYATDIEGNNYDIEMQTTKEASLGKRTRYYHSEMDGYALKRGKDYSELGNNIVIFICTYDCFDENRSVYTFRSTCVENKELYLDDGAETIILNVNGNRDSIDGKLTAVLDYIKTGDATDEYTEDLNQSVVTLNNDKNWRDKHVTLQMKMDEKYRAGKAEGKAEERWELLVAMVNDGEITIENAARRLNITPEEFSQKLTLINK